MSGPGTTSAPIATTVELLQKKYLGSVNSLQGVSYVNENPGNARPRIFHDKQIFVQNVPPVAPTDLSSNITYIYGTLLANGNYGNFQSSSSSTAPANNTLCGTIQTSISYPYIQKITNLYLSYVAQNSSYWFANPTGSITNYLSNIIPYNYDPATSTYNYILNSSNNPTKQYLASNAPIWLVDSDAGYLYFPNNDWTSNGPGGIPIISFYRYNGLMGLSTLPSLTINGALTCNTSGYISAGSTSSSSVTFSPNPGILTCTFGNNYSANKYIITGNISSLNFSGGVSNGTYIVYLTSSASSSLILKKDTNMVPLLFINGGANQTLQVTSSSYILLTVIFDGTSYFLSASTFS